MLGRVFCADLKFEWEFFAEYSESYLQIEMASSSYGRMEVEKFNGTNFELWKLKMEDIIEDRDLWEDFSLDVKPAVISQADWEIKDQKAKGLIRLCLADVILLNVLDETTENSLWK